MEVSCRAISSQSILVNWQPPPLLKQNGILLGYRVYYENEEEWPPGKYIPSSFIIITIFHAFVKLTEVNSKTNRHNLAYMLRNTLKLGDTEMVFLSTFIA